jgi:hypothetical protein
VLFARGFFRNDFYAFDAYAPRPKRAKKPVIASKTDTGSSPVYLPFLEYGMSKYKSLNKNFILGWGVKDRKVGLKSYYCRW